MNRQLYKPANAEEQARYNKMLSKLPFDLEEAVKEQHQLLSQEHENTQTQFLLSKVIAIAVACGLDPKEYQIVGRTDEDGKCGMHVRGVWVISTSAKAQCYHIEKSNFDLALKIVEIFVLYDTKGFEPRSHFELEPKQPTAPGEKKKRRSIHR